MNQKLSLEQQVAQLTEAQKKAIRKIGFYGTAFGTVPAIAIAVIAMAVMVWTMMTAPEAVSDVMPICMVVCLCAFAWCMGLILFIKIKFPFYSDAKLKYLKKHP